MSRLLILYPLLQLSLFAELFHEMLAYKHGLSLVPFLEVKPSPYSSFVLHPLQAGPLDKDLVLRELCRLTGCARVLGPPLQLRMQSAGSERIR